MRKVQDQGQKAKAGTGPRVSPVITQGVWSDETGLSCSHQVRAVSAGSEQVREVRPG